MGQVDLCTLGASVITQSICGFDYEDVPSSLSCWVSGNTGFSRLASGTDGRSWILSGQTQQHRLRRDATRPVPHTLPHRRVLQRILWSGWSYRVLPQRLQGNFLRDEATRDQLQVLRRGSLWGEISPAP